MRSVIALVVAAGRGRRLGGDLPKQYQNLAGRAVLRHSLARLAADPQVDAVRVVIHPDDRDLYDEAARGLRLLPPVAGGETRQSSVRLGLESLVEEAPEVVLIHDGARPFLDSGVLFRTLSALEHHAGAIPVLPVTDTLKRADANGCIRTGIPREGLYRAQTPQAFRFIPILEAHRATAALNLTDDAAVAEVAGLSVAWVEGHEDNVKITTLTDLDRARKGLTQGGGGDFRTGTGFDVHRFTAGTGVWLCGVFVPHDQGLEGHSDADVALHAATDAVLGSIGAGDIGRHFPPSEAAWKGAASDQFLAHAVGLVRALGGRIVNLDLTLICERPKLGVHRGAMQARVAEILGVRQDRVGIKATTTEGLGFTGRKEGIAALATATVFIPEA